MTESDWWTCQESEKMLQFLRDSGKLTERKGRLFGVAVCRRIWHLLADERSRRAVEVLERYADGGATLDELALANEGAEDACNPRAKKGEHKAALAVSAASGEHWDDVDEAV
jgi:hypothetical protein